MKRVAYGRGYGAGVFGANRVHVLYGGLGG